MKASPSQADIQGICRFFSIGKPQDYKEEKGITFPHANFFAVVSSPEGKYILKFYPSHNADKIMIEHTINRILRDHGFATPLMHAGLRKLSFCANNNRLVTCYSYIKGSSAWDHIKEQDTFRQINAALLSLKDILSTNKKRIPSLKQETLTITLNSLVRKLKLIVPHDQKETVHASLLDACRVFQQDQPLFSRQWLHSDANLTNFLIYKKTIQTLDLEHVREDYILCDLATLIVSCILSVPLTTIKFIVEDYFTRHKIKTDHFLVLNTLIKIGLVKEYFGRTQDDHKRPIISVLKKINANPRLIV